jgi:hypothetical protein
MLAIGPDVPPALAPLLISIVDAINDLQAPGKPMRVAKTTFAKLPPAAQWPDCIIEVSDKNSLAISTQTVGGWSWTRADGSAL